MANTSILGLTKPSYTDDADISDLNGNFDLIDAEAGRLRANFAPTYSTSSAYAVGDYVVYTGNLYRCTTAIGSGGESWTAGHWTQVAIGTEVKGLSDQFANLIKSVSFDVTTDTDGDFTVPVTYNNNTVLVMYVDRGAGSSYFVGFASIIANKNAQNRWAGKVLADNLTNVASQTMKVIMLYI